MNESIIRTSGLHRTLRSLAVFALAGAGMLGATGLSAAGAAEPDAVVRAAHFSPTTPGVDVYLGPFSGGTSKLWLNTVSYGAVSPYQRLTPGLYTVSMRPAGASPSTPAMLSWTLDAKSGAAYTVAGVGADASVRGVVIRDDLTAPRAGQGRVRVIQAASRAPVATVSAKSGPVIAADAQFATATDYAAVPAGTWNVSAVSTSAPSVATSSPVDVSAGAITSVLILDAKSSGITLRTVLDSSSSGVVPTGSVPAGAGGTAQHVIGGGGAGSHLGSEAGVGALAALVVSLGLWLVRERSVRAAHVGRHGTV